MSGRGGNGGQPETIAKGEVPAMGRGVHAPRTCILGALSIIVAVRPGKSCSKASSATGGYKTRLSFGTMAAEPAAIRYVEPGCDRGSRLAGLSPRPSVAGPTHRLRGRLYWATARATAQRRFELPCEAKPEQLNPESTEGGRLVSILKWPEGALLNLG